MESFSVETERGKKETPRTRRKGGIITLPFIIANESFEKVASYGLLPNMTFYMMKDYGMSVKKATNLLFFWSAATYFTPTVGAFVADSYLGRFLTIALGSIFSLLCLVGKYRHFMALGLENFKGVILLWLTAMIPRLRPPTCNMSAPSCTSATSSQFGILISAIILLSIGAGGIRSSSIVFGADQIDKNDNPKNEKALETFFNWYYFTATASVLIAVTGIVYIQDHIGWKVGYGVPAILMFLATFLFLAASTFYINRPVGRSMFTGFAQVIVVAFKNRRLALPPPNSAQYHNHKGSEYTVPTDRLRFLNKACIITNNEDVTTDGVATNAWNLCTVDQIEELKTLIRVMPLWSTGIMFSLSASQSFPLLQANSMDRHLTSNFQIPAGSFGVFVEISLIVWLFLYDRILLPLASKMRGKPVKISPKIRMGIGLFISSLTSAAAGTLEYFRRKMAIKQGFLNNPQAVVDMSALWLVLQNSLYGIAVAFNAIGQIEFYYSEFPRSMSSIGASMYQLGIAVANLLSSFVLNLVDKYTKGEGKETWISNNINKGHYDYYYWLLGILNFINLLYYMLCSWAYGPSVNRNERIDQFQNSRRHDPLKIQHSDD